MEDEKARPQAPGLRYDGGRPMWRASKPALRAGYPVKSVNLSMLADSGPALVARCNRLQSEMLEWLSRGAHKAIAFDGTFATLLDAYTTDPESPYNSELKHASRHPYTVYARKLKAMIGTRRIDACDGRDLKRWFAVWAEPDRPGNPPKLAAAKMTVAVLRAAITFGKTCRMPGCADFKSIMEEIEFPSPRAREEAPTAQQVIAAREAAHALGHPRAALAYAIQYETTLRQWDVIGQWTPLSDPRPSAVIDGADKWFGLSWTQIDEHGVLRVTPTKTEATSRARTIFDLRACSMIVEELAKIPATEQRGPLIVNLKTGGLPYRHDTWGDVWRAVRKAAGIPRSVWNRDLRAGGISEGRAADVSLDDMAKIAGHTKKRTTGDVYDRTALETHRRAAAKRNTHRESGGA